MQSNGRGMPCWGGVQQFRKPANWRWWLVPRWGNCYERRGAADAISVFSELLANCRGLFGVPQYCALGGKEFLLCLSGVAFSQAPGSLRGVRLHAALRRHQRRWQLAALRTTPETRGVARLLSQCPIGSPD